MAEENENAQAESMFQSWDGKPIYAKKAELDKNGNSLELTIEGDTVTAIGGKSVGGGGSDIPTEGDVGQVLTKTQDGYDWEDAPVPDPELPDDGTPGQVLTKTQDGFEWSAVPTELPSSTQFDKDKVLVRTESGYDWKYVVPLRWFANTPDDATLEIDNNSYRNVIVDSVNNITFNVTTSSTHDFPNFVLDIHIDANASIETLKINVTWTINATQHAGVETLHCPVTGNTLTVLPGEYY